MNIFVDPADGAAYIIYSVADGANNWDHENYMLVQRLTHDGRHGERGASSDRFGPAPAEAPVLFKRGGSYYAAFGRNCFCCDYGAEIFMFRAPHPLGPWTGGRDVNIGSNGQRSVRGQTAFVLSVPSPTAGADPTVMIALDQWMTGSTRAAMFQYWGQLTFDEKGDVMDLWWTDTWTLPLPAPVSSPPPPPPPPPMSRPSTSPPRRFRRRRRRRCRGHRRRRRRAASPPPKSDLADAPTSVAATPAAAKVVAACRGSCQLSGDARRGRPGERRRARVRVYLGLDGPLERSWECWRSRSPAALGVASALRLRRPTPLFSRAGGLPSSRRLAVTLVADNGCRVACGRDRAAEGSIWMRARKLRSRPRCRCTSS